MLQIYVIWSLFGEVIKLANCITAKQKEENRLNGACNDSTEYWCPCCGRRKLEWKGGKYRCECGFATIDFKKIIFSSHD